MIVTNKVTLATQGDCHVIDISDEVSREVTASGLADGIVTVFVVGTTAGVAVVEYEQGLVEDLSERHGTAHPPGIPYQHNILNHDDNGHAHTQATLMGQSLVVPFSGKKPLLGTWQRIVVVDFDSRPRNREIVVQVMGE